MSKDANLSNVCAECPARCCTRSRWIFDKVRLTMPESCHPLLAPHVVWHRNPDDPKRQLPYMTLDPRCPQLGEDNRCTIYEDRPEACRKYVCHESEDTIRYIHNHSDHGDLLRKFGVFPKRKRKTKEKI